ncbi:hypothetical protein P152DRAFT_461174 [Eremomyces bilateralis CBS 781.70]|uniref:Uncharacterized protein n=1 Tax=Eremomyces bilateralis CBS 781.70 TaxID=1392243 RepID=A0A6G1FVP7_9PEZI|nr:uncharacterized protein P152DRAFT_461174 [Eremomyces bilateralis CBS 781.70]KAF1809788.1 hypothetical protein P152DRAFT_461174 [Eremomyces bilateralis CBS 781.70]
MGLNYYASAPTLILGPSQPSNIFNNPQHDQPDQVMAGTLPRRKRLQPRFPAPPSMNYLAKANTNLAGRKRSFDDLDSCDEPADPLAVCTINGSTASTPSAEPIHDPGMALFYPDGLSLNIAAECQVGISAQTHFPGDEMEKFSALPREPLARKSQRLQNGVTAGNHVQALETAIPATMPSTPTDAIDQLNITLGIGWKRLSVHLIDASKGWERYIENHYPLGSASILLFSEALNTYLVRTVLQSPLTDPSSPYERYYLFKEDLSCAQLVGANADQAIQSLTNKEVSADGTVLQHVITRGETIRAASRTSPSNTPGPSPATMEVAEFEMEM